MPYTVSCNPAPLTFTIRPKFNWQFLVSGAWICFVGYAVFFAHWRSINSDDILEIGLFTIISLTMVMAFIRRERIEIYSEQMIWRKTYFGITKSNAAPLDDVLGAEWNEG